MGLNRLHDEPTQLPLRKALPTKQCSGVPAAHTPVELTFQNHNSHARCAYQGRGRTDVRLMLNPQAIGISIVGGVAVALSFFRRGLGGCRVVLGTVL